MSKSSFVHNQTNPAMQLHGISGLGGFTNSQLESHIRANILAHKTGPSMSYVHLIANDIRKRSNHAAEGSHWGKMASDYYARHGLDPFKIAVAMHNDTGLLPPNADKEDVNNDSGLARALEKLDGYLAGTYGHGPGYHGGGATGGGATGGGAAGGGSTSSGGGTTTTTGNGTSYQAASMFGGISPVWIFGGIAAVGGLLLLTKK